MNEVALDDPDNPEWTEEDFRRAKPASEVLGAKHAAMLVRQKPTTGVRLIARQSWARTGKLAT